MTSARDTVDRSQVCPVRAQLVILTPFTDEGLKALGWRVGRGGALLRPPRYADAKPTCALQAEFDEPRPECAQVHATLSLGFLHVAERYNAAVRAAW